jgi:hypothetical protein
MKKILNLLRPFIYIGAVKNESVLKKTAAAAQVDAVPFLQVTAADSFVFDKANMSQKRLGFFLIRQAERL